MRQKMERFNGKQTSRLGTRERGHAKKPLLRRRRKGATEEKTEGSIRT